MPIRIILHVLQLYHFPDPFLPDAITVLSSISVKSFSLLSIPPPYCRTTLPSLTVHIVVVLFTHPTTSSSSHGQGCDG